MTKKPNDLRREQGVFQYYPEDEHDKDFDLSAASGETFDYEEYKSDEAVELSVAVCMLCNLGDRGAFYWRQGGKDDYDKMHDHVLNAVAAKKLNKLDENRVNVFELIQWAKQSGYQIPKQLDRYVFTKPLDARNTEIMEDAFELAKKLKSEGMKKLTKDALGYKLSLEKDYGVSVGTITRNINNWPDIKRKLKL